MNSVQGLLDRYGIPPPGLCVDWAIQLQDFVSVDMPSRTRVASESIHWSDLELDDEGRLIPPRAACSVARISTESVAPLMKDLERWASAADAHGEFSESSDTDRARLSGMKRANMTQAEDTPLSDRKKSEKLTGVRIEPRNAQAADGRAAPPRAPTRTAESISSAIPHISLRSRLRKRQLFAVGVVGCVVAVASGWYYLIDASAFNEVASGRENKRSGIERVPSADVPLRLSSEKSSSSSQLVLSTAADQPRSFSEAGGEGLSAMDGSPALLDQVDIDPGRIENPDPHRRQASSAASSPGSSASDRASHLPRDEDAEEDRFDVLQELDGLAEHIPAASVSDDSTLPANSESAYSPLSIDLSLPQQVHRLAAQASVRQPEWKLRLGASEGFVCEPPGMQTLGPGEATGWSIQAEDAQPPVTRIFVGVQLVSPRRPDLRIRVHITASDLPQLALPAKSSFLNAAERLLSDFRRRGLFQLQQLRELSRTAGVPSHVRSSTAQRRRYLEDQVAQAERLIQIVADAQQLSAWLAGELEMHAALIDAATNNATPAVQFGSLEDTAAPANGDRR